LRSSAVGQPIYIYYSNQVLSFYIHVFTDQLGWRCFEGIKCGPLIFAVKTANEWSISAKRFPSESGTVKYDKHKNGFLIENDCALDCRKDVIIQCIWQPPLGHLRTEQHLVLVVLPD